MRQQRAFIDRIAFIDEHFGNPPADAKAKPHLPNVDVSIERQMVVLFMRPPKVRGKVEPPRSRSTRNQKENQDKGELLFPCSGASLPLRGFGFKDSAGLGHLFVFQIVNFANLLGSI